MLAGCPGPGWAPVASSVKRECEHFAQQEAGGWIGATPKDPFRQWSPSRPSCLRLAPPAPSTAIQTAIRLQAEGKTSLHKDLKQKRREQREQRERRRAAKEEEMLRLQQLQEEKERKLQELELLQEAQRQAERLMQEEEERRRSQHRELQQALEVQLREAEQVRLHPGGGGGPRGEVPGGRGPGGAWAGGGATP